MAKIVLLIVLVVAIVAWFGRRSRNVTSDRGSARGGRPPQLQAMVSCAHCGVHLPQHDAVLRLGHAYCSPAHAEAGPRLPGQ